MPLKHTIKKYYPNSFYHLFNRGVEKRKIFQDEQDYQVFLGYLKEYLQPKKTDELYKKLANPILNYKEKNKILKLLKLNNFHGEIHLLCFCLMPNHFHLLVKQKSPQGIDMFMQSLTTRYSMFFNRKYKRVGPLFQGPYKAVNVTTDEQLLHLSRYIHLNPKHLLTGKDPVRIYSSYKYYLGKNKANWLETDLILSHFSKNNSLLTYKAFVEGPAETGIIKKLVLE